MKENDRKHTPLPWKVVRNPMRDDGWFVRQDIPEAPRPGITRLDGSAVMKPSPGITSFQIYKKEDAEFIALACNSHYELLTALREMMNTHGMHGPCEDHNCSECCKAYDLAEAAIDRTARANTTTTPNQAEPPPT